VIKEARRQAYRYGRQLSLTQPDTDEHQRVTAAWEAFIGQFDNLDADDTITAFVRTGFVHGTIGDEATDIAMSFTRGFTGQSY
jgi:hypothetical protein